MTKTCSIANLENKYCHVLLWMISKNKHHTFQPNMTTLQKLTSLDLDLQNKPGCGFMPLLNNEKLRAAIEIHPKTKPSH